MNYEEFLAKITPLAKSIKDASAAIAKYQKSLTKDADSGDFRNISKNIQNFENLISNQQELLSQLKSAVADFDYEEYFRSGDFVTQMLDECASNNVDVIGETPSFEMFPLRIKIDTETQEIFVNNKKFPCMRPKSLVSTVKARQSKLQKANFNPEGFASELAEAYDTTVLKLKRQDGSDINLNSIYKTMVPMGRLKKAYDIQDFAYDLARLNDKNKEASVYTKDGRRFQFGPFRQNVKSIRILNQYGVEEFLTSIRFYKE